MGKVERRRDDVAGNFRPLEESTPVLELLCLLFGLRKEERH